MMSRPLLEDVVVFASNVNDGNMPAEMMADARRRVVDVIGNSLAALTTGVATIARGIADDWSASGDCTALTGGKHPPATTAFVNGTLAHALDFDDTHLPSVLHPSATTVPAALAAAEFADTTLSDLYRAIAAGNELTVRLGMAGFDPILGNSVFFERGFHATAICGAMGGALAAAMLLGLEEDAIGHAVSIAASMGAGVLEANRTGGDVKRIHCGWAAHAAVSAAQLARRGLTGPPTIFEGRFGILQAFCGDQARSSELVDELGVRWASARTFFKPYPCNHFTHAGIDAALELRRRGVVAADVVHIELGVASPVLRTIAEPAGQKARPATPYAAQFSGPFTFATALVGGAGLGLHLEDFSDLTINDPTRLELAAKVRCVPNQDCNRVFPYQFPAVVRIETKHGAHEVRVMANRGGPENPLTDAELELKFALNAELGVGPERAEGVQQAIRSFGGDASVRGFMQALGSF